MTRPTPDWRGKTKQPKGPLGPKPRPNGRVVATRPGIPPLYDANTYLQRLTNRRLALVPAGRPERPEDV